MIARRGQAGQPLAGACEQNDAEFVFEFADLPADARLRGVQRMGCFGEVEAASDGFRLPHLLRR